MSIGARDSALIFGAALRLTRLVVADDVGRWWLKQPAENWVDRGTGYGAVAWSPEGEPLTGRAKLVSGLDCPHCSGYYIGVGVLSSYLLARRRRWSLSLWRWVAAGLALNAAVTLVGGTAGYFEGGTVMEGGGE